MSGKKGTLRPHEAKVTVAQRAVDAALIAAAYGVSLVVAHAAWNVSHGLLLTLTLLAFAFLADANGLYRSFRGVPFSRELIRVVTAFAFVVPIAIFAPVVLGEAALPNHALAVFALAGLGGLVAVRAIVREVLKRLRVRGYNSRSVAIYGATEIGVELARKIASEPWAGLRLLGLYDDRSEDRRVAIPETQMLGRRHSLVDAARRGEIDIVYVALPMRAEERVRDLVTALADTTASVYMAPNFQDFELLQARMSAVGNVPVVSLVETPFRGTHRFLKRAEDIVLGLGILCLISLPMLVIAIAVRLTSRGPVFFRQRRYGLNGEEIRVLKFRTMTVCEDGPNVKQATKNDARVTRIGAFLRKNSLDELPQFLQVLTGEMSIVGPRPHAVAHNEEYRRQIGGYMLRHKVKPGITGWAQVNGYRGETDTLEKMQKRVEHDLEYIRNWRLTWDLQIILLTALGARAKQNAY